MANVNDININPKLVKIPSGFSNLPQVGKIQQLYDLNNNDLYKRLSPFTPNSGLLSFGPRQPFVYVSPNKGRKGINGLKRFESRIFPIGSALQDVQRIAQFMVTGKGILFLTKQFLLQRTQPFNETRIYNPLSVINAVIRPVTGFILPPPIRHLSGGLLGALASLVGINVSSDKPIKGTAAKGNPDILPKFEQTVHSSRYGKGFTGLIRGGTAASAYYVKKPAGALGGLINFAKKLFGGTVNQPPGTKFRADEAYPVFDLKAKKEFGSYNQFGVLSELHQRWYNDKDSSGAKIDDPGNEHRLKFPKARSGPDSRSFPIAYIDKKKNEAQKSTFAEGKNTFQGQEIGGELKAKYGDTIFANSSNPYARSEIILIYKKYVEYDASGEGRKLYNKIPRNLSQGYNYTAQGSKGYISQLDTDGTHKLLFFRTARLTKGTYEATIDRYDDGFDKIPLPKKIEYSTNGPGSDKTPLTRHREKLETHSYNLGIKNKLQSLLKKGGEGNEYGIYNVKNYVSDVDMNYGTLMARRKSPLDQKTLPEDGYQNRLKTNGSVSLEDNSGKGFAGTGKSDYVNSLQILSANDVDGTEPGYGASDLTIYEPYKDDQIAFYFHDLVNDKYIPFRATVKGLSEQLSADWSEVSYIGRADKLHNYTGFKRTISFNFQVVAMSISELMPMWKRINYLASLTKPSKYTEHTSKVQVGNFITPPLITFTIGDMYKEQPLILQTVGITIPDEALWETLSEKYTTDWEYLNGKIKWDKSSGFVAQFPRECDITIGGILLEQERPQTGRNNFGGIDKNAGDFSKNLSIA